MGLKGTFKQVHCNKLGGRMWSFELSNTNIWQKEVYTIAIYDVYQQNPWIWRNQVLKSDETAVLNYDNIGWLFCH